MIKITRDSLSHCNIGKEKRKKIKERTFNTTTTIKKNLKTKRRSLFHSLNWLAIINSYDPIKNIGFEESGSKTR